jgi:circadian clock protein KaiC
MGEKRLNRSIIACIIMETLSSNVPGLDEILNGGFIRGRMYLIRGEPGVGKSLLGAHFLREGLDNGETVLYIHGEESEADIIENTRELNIDLSEAEFLDLGPEADFFTESVSYDVVDPADLDSERVTDDIQEKIDALNPNRVFLDPITQLEYVETNEYQYRKRLLSLLRFLRDRNMTVLASKTWDEGRRAKLGSSDNAESISDGLVDMFRGEGGRRIKVPKHRGHGQSDHTHGLEIRANGLEVYPQVIPGDDYRQFDPTLVPSGREDLDALLGGGIEKGSITFLSGPTGVGKSTLATQLAVGAAQADLRVGSYLFEESLQQFEYRAEGLGYPIADLRADGDVVLTHIEPLNLSAEEFAQQVTGTVADLGLDVVILDGIDGYQLSIQGDESELIRRLHALTRSLKQKGVTVFITDEVSEISGLVSATSTNTSYIADNIVYLTYKKGETGLDRAIGVLKKRLGEFDNSFHYFTITHGEGIVIGDEVRDMEGLVD